MLSNVPHTRVEKLADEVYHYDTRDKIFEKATAFEERQKAKGKEQTMGTTSKQVL